MSFVLSMLRERLSAWPHVARSATALLYDDTSPYLMRMGSRLCCPPVRHRTQSYIGMQSVCSRGSEAAALRGGGADEVSEEDVQLLFLDVWGPVGEEVKHQATDVAARGGWHSAGR
ncbi:unnamed protein product [Pleuronectes platessa]|uniref:Uncharacterized protein n=1 Tax=Pleuronectes platessa TaxID=8262 RepID=A0A9N7TZB2_PLEPL|nr:unnamed protein product [Pleuronectes platessa]